MERSELVHYNKHTAGDMLEQPAFFFLFLFEAQ